MWKWSYSKEAEGVVIYNPESKEIVRDGAGKPQTFRPRDVQGIVDEMNAEASNGVAAGKSTDGRTSEALKASDDGQG